MVSRGYDLWSRWGFQILAALSLDLGQTINLSCRVILRMVVVSTIVLLRGFTEIIYVKYLEKWMADSKSLINVSYYSS